MNENEILCNNCHWRIAHLIPYVYKNKLWEVLVRVSQATFRNRVHTGVFHNPIGFDNFLE